MKSKVRGTRKVKGRSRLWLGVLPALMLPLLGSLFYFVIAGAHPAARWGYGLVKAFTLMWPVVVLCWWREPIRFRLARSVGIGRSLLEGGGSGIVMGGIVLVALLTPVRGVADGASGAITAKLTVLGLLDSYWIFAIVLAVGHSLLEEYYWRGFVFGQLRRLLPLGWAHGLAGFSFSWHHIVLCSQFFPLGWALVFGGCVMGAGCVWSVLYERHGHFWGAWISHVIVDVVLLGLGGMIVFG